jgi:hypothetical protein
MEFFFICRKSSNAIVAHTHGTNKYQTCQHTKLDKYLVCGKLLDQIKPAIEISVIHISQSLYLIREEH